MRDIKFSVKRKAREFVGISSKVILNIMTPRNSQLQTNNTLTITEYENAVPIVTATSN